MSLNPHTHLTLHSPLRAPETGDGSSYGGGSGTYPGSPSDTHGSLTGQMTRHETYGSSQHQTDAGASAAPWSWTDTEGRLSKGWLDKLGPELATSGSLKSIQTVGDLAKSYHATKALVGKKLEMPARDAAPERWAEWRKVTGAPERPEGYRGQAESLRPQALPAEGWDMQAEGEFLSIAHKHGLPPQAVTDIMDFYGKSVISGFERSQTEETAFIQMETHKLRGEWGRDFDVQLGHAARMARLAGLDPATHPIFTRAEVVKAFAGLAKLITGDSAVKGEQSGLGTSVAERIRDITDPRGTSQLAREYRGEHGPDRQTSAQSALHQLMAYQNE